MAASNEQRPFAVSYDDGIQGQADSLSMSLDNEFFEEKSRFSIEAFEDCENEEYQPFLSELRNFLWGICFVSIILSILVIPWNESAIGIIMSFFFPCYEGKILEQSFRDDLERGTRLRRFPY